MSRSRTVTRAVLRVVLLLIGAFLVARAVVEVVTVDPGDPASYRDDWGGPSYVGVLAVHAGPGVVVVGLLVLSWWRRRTEPARTPNR